MDTTVPPKRGLSALLSSTTGKAPSGAGSEADLGSVVLLDLAVTSIRPNSTQPRTQFDESSLMELAASIKAQGLVQPIVVRRSDRADALGGSQYELIAGERRWRAAQLAGLTKVPAIVKAVFEDRDILLLSLVENLQRDDLSPIEEATAYERLAKTFGLKHEEIADAVGKSRATVTNSIRLLELPSSIQEAIKTKRITPAHAMILLSIPDAKVQSQLAAKVQAENLTVRDLERLVSWQHSKSHLPQVSERPKGTRNTRVAAPEVQEAERQLREHFGTRVLIEEGVRKGRIIIEFYSVSDFQRIIGLMSSGNEHA